MTVRESLGRAVGILEAAGFTPEDARSDVSVLARHALGWTMAEWAAGLREGAPPDLADRLAQMAERRARHEPIAYITGTREFYGRAFHVKRGVAPLVMISEVNGYFGRNHFGQDYLTKFKRGKTCR